MSAVLGAIKDATTVVAVLVGGGWAVYKFGLHRVNESFLALAVDGLIFSSEREPTRVIVEASARNLGTIGVYRGLAWIEVQPLRTENRAPERPTLVQPKKSDKVRRYGIFNSYTYLEPGEEFRDSLLLQIPSATDFLIIRLFYSGRRPGETWHTQKIIATRRTAEPR